MSEPLITFEQCIQRRRRIWWGQPGGWRSPGLWKRPLHHLLDRQLMRDRYWPSERWRCCDLWQRCLSHKWNSREFASAHGVQVPELYWKGHRLSRLPINELPEHVVIKPAWGFGGKGTYLLSGSMELVSGQHWQRSELLRQLVRDHGVIQRFPYLAEEMMTTEDGDHRQGVEYSFFMFAGHLGAIMRLQRFRSSLAHYSLYTPDWTPLTTPYFYTLEPGPPQPPPASLDAMCRVARTLGQAVGTFMRVDLYSTQKGVVFGEFASTPRTGSVSAFGNSFMGRIWQEQIPDCI
jgi:hypothetical protein